MVLGDNARFERTKRALQDIPPAVTVQGEAAVGPGD